MQLAANAAANFCPLAHISFLIPSWHIDNGAFSSRKIPAPEIEMHAAAAAAAATAIFGGETPRVGGHRVCLSVCLSVRLLPRLLAYCCCCCCCCLCKTADGNYEDEEGSEELEAEETLSTID
jgi:hypothetical protein